MKVGSTLTVAGGVTSQVAGSSEAIRSSTCPGCGIDLLAARPSARQKESEIPSNKRAMAAMTMLAAVAASIPRHTLGPKLPGRPNAQPASRTSNLAAWGTFDMSKQVLIG